MITNYRMLNQQLLCPRFNSPEELVSWMGAIQAQDYAMSKWAVGIRLKSATQEDVQAALDEGTLLRTHILRPTWHLVSAKDIRWMVKLNGERIRKACRSWAKQQGVPVECYEGVSDLFYQLLGGNRHLTREEMEKEACTIDKRWAPEYFRYLLNEVEAMGMVCSGRDKEGKNTYALLEERVPEIPELSRDEALVLLARKYFQSHSPATLTDFVWWSGLTLKEARQAIAGMGDHLVTESYGEQLYYLTPSSLPEPEEVLHFLPPYDEYLISYKDRTAALAREHYPKAFNNWGIFHPVLLHNGRIVGNWERSGALKSKKCKTEFFEKCRATDELIAGAEARYRAFHCKSSAK